MTGAPRLIAGAAARIGAGLVVVAVPDVDPARGAGRQRRIRVRAARRRRPPGRWRPARSRRCSSARTRGRARDRSGPHAQRGDRRLRSATSCRASPVPVALDADGLNAFTGRAADAADRKADLVMTPHEGEFGRLTGVDARDARERSPGRRARSGGLRQRGRAVEGHPHDRRRTGRPRVASTPRAVPCWPPPGPATCSPA